MTETLVGVEDRGTRSKDRWEDHVWVFFLALLKPLVEFLKLQHSANHPTISTDGKTRSRENPIV
jgi:hypothetical protein